MKFLTAILILALATVVLGSSVEKEWNEYKQKFNKKYEPAEDVKRFEIFRKKLLEFEVHNEKYKKGEVTWEAGVNQFTDQTEEEFNNQNHGVLNPYTSNH